ncbi:MAG: tetratricopeptide repeat protein [Candidatus Auribacter fodinae]|jgi:Flp pilus assembly protein TadD|uniref:Tetratricopeptide repeat protein n=1 Tax=Candidatus Auribacter fodinae TaxID=2093366 RepID=A0A3A4RDA2_9BACT|nr:MAG: tetratricopeptide repeat protein [Candidatus Auribacter fodinae]
MVLRHTLLRKHYVFPLLIFAAAFSIRFMYLEQIKTNPFFEPRSLDPFFYHSWAQDIAHGNLNGDGVFRGMPLYAYLLGTIYKLTEDSLYCAYCANSLLGALSCMLIFFIGKKLFGSATGIIAGLLAVFYKPFIFYEGMLVGVTLAVFLYLLCLLLLLRFTTQPNSKDAILTGAIIGISALCRASILLLPIITIFFYPRFLKKVYKGEFIKKSLIIILCAYSIVLATGIRNYIIAKDFVLITAHSGLNFYIGNNSSATGKFHAPDGVGRQPELMMSNAHAMAEKTLGRTLKPSEASAYWKQLGQSFIITHPYSYIRLLLKKLTLFFQGAEIADFRNITFFERFSSIMRLPLVTYQFIIPLAILGLIITRKQRGDISILRYFIISNLISVILYFVNSRYRLPAVPVFIIFAAYALKSIAEKIREKDVKRVAGLATALIVLFSATFITREQVDLSDDYNELASWYVYNKKDIARGIALFREALKISPENEYVWFNLGRTYFEDNRLEEAEECFLNTIEFNKDDYESYNILGIIYTRMRRLDDALSAYEKSLQINPAYYKAINNMAEVYIIIGDNDKAEQLRKRSLSINPDQPMLIEKIK